MAKDGSIEVNVRNSADLFQQPIRYVVPPYQRRYGGLKMTSGILCGRT